MTRMVVERGRKLGDDVGWSPAGHCPIDGLFMAFEAYCRLDDDGEESQSRERARGGREAAVVRYYRHHFPIVTHNNWGHRPLLPRQAGANLCVLYHFEIRLRALF